MIKSQLKQWNFHNKKIFLRADLNVPLSNGIILNDFRLQSIMPTLNYVLEKNNMVILATHLGKPHGYEKNLSTKILITWFKEHHYNIVFAPDIKSILSMPFQPKLVVLLENLRFWPEEQNADPIFAKQLAQTAQYYVNDAFGTIHRNDCSICLLPYEFAEQRRSIGFLMEKELNTLENLIHHPKKPFVAILGGKKISEKIPLIKKLLQSADTLLLCPAICFSFLKAMNKPVGLSLVDTSIIPLCKEILSYAQDNHITIVFPHDYLIAEEVIDEPLSYITNSSIPDNACGIAIGPQTVNAFSPIIKEANTIFFNGAMGFAERPETRQTTYDILRVISKSQGISYVAGGDAVEATFTAGLSQDIDYLSTGGGAALAYLGGNQLPGLIPFEEY